MGYCNVGSILEVGPGVSSASFPQDRVVSNGNHAEIVSVAKNLCCKVPQGRRRSVLHCGRGHSSRNSFASANSWRINCDRPRPRSVVRADVESQRLPSLGIDFDFSKCALAKSYGAEVVDLSKGEDPVSKAMAWSHGRGVDGVFTIQRACSSGRIDVTETRSHCFGRSSRARAFKSRFL